MPLRRGALRSRASKKLSSPQALLRWIEQTQIYLPAYEVGPMPRLRRSRKEINKICILLDVINSIIT